MVDGAKPGQDGHFFGAIRIEAFEDLARLKHRVDAIVRELHASQRANGIERVYAPGQIETETEALYRENGIPLNDVTLTAFTDVARRLDVPAEL